MMHSAQVSDTDNLTLLNFGISSTKTTALYQKMDALHIYEKDIQESFIHASGKGGQNVNKVATCVRLKHLPSGIEIKCQKSRQQLLNRYLARCLLTKKIETLTLGKKSEETKRIEKIRRQKRKRSKRAKEKMLDSKTLHAKKKGNRKSISNNDSH